jgi:hypothetical protein
MFNKRLKDFFVPSADNNYAPHSLQKAAMLGMVILIVLSFTATNVQSLIWMSSKWMVSTVLPAVIVDLTNDERDTQSLGTLTRNSVLDAAAKLKAEDMAKEQYFAHYSPEGVSPWYWFGQVSYNFVHAGENLAIYFTDSGDIVDAWMDSPAHRDNIMNDDYTEIGVGTAEGTYKGYQTVYVVQLFGTPAASAPSSPVSVSENEVADVALAEPTNTSEQESAVLAESVSITEEISVVPSQAVANQIAPSAETQTTVVNDMDVLGGGTVVLYSDLISTSTGGVPATVDSSQNIQENSNTPFYLALATQPHKILQIAYIVIGLFVLGLLLLSILIEYRHQQPIQIAYGVGLLAVMLCLFYIHTILSAGALVV